MEVGMRVRFDTLTEKKSKKGEFKEEFDLAIVDEQNKKRALETYSGGETKRIGVCVGFALRELTLNKGYSNFSFLLMDEVIDSLDETGIGEFFNLLDNITGLKLLITHNSDLKSRFSDVVRIAKTDGKSTIHQT
jgi:DNA repair exonuclease SbcCD ATPase subunit